MTKHLDVLDRLAPLVGTSEPSIEMFLRRRDRKRRNERIGAAVVGLSVFLAAVWLVTNAGSYDGAPVPANSSPGPTAPTPSVEFTADPARNFVLDLNTGDVTPLPAAILRTVDRSRWTGRYAPSPDGTRLAYVGIARNGSRQIFVARLDGSRIRQVTRDPVGAFAPAWSPDATMIAYLGRAELGGGRLFVLDLATGGSTSVNNEHGGEPQFTPDGSSIVYPSEGTRRLLIAPATGGPGAVFMKPGRGLHDAGNAAISPDGTLVTYLGGGSPKAPDGSPLKFHGREIEHAGPGRFISRLDGTRFRLLPCFEVNSAGAWSPDGTRVVCSGGRNRIVVVDVATGTPTHVADGRLAVWVDDHTLIVEE